MQRHGRRLDTLIACGIFLLGLLGPCYASVYDTRPQSLQDFRPSATATGLDADMLSQAVANGQTAFINQLIALFDGGLRTLLDVMYAANPFAKETTERNTQVLSQSQQHALARSQAATQNALNAALTGYIGFESVDAPINPAASSTPKARYVDFLQRTSLYTLLGNKDIDIPDPSSEDSMDLSELVERVEGRTYAAYLGQKSASDNKTHPLVKSLSEDTNIRNLLSKLWSARTQCWPKDDVPPAKAYEDCRLNAEKEAALYQKFLMLLLFNPNHQAEINQVIQHNDNYSAKNFLHPQGYTNTADRLAARQFLQRIKSYGALPPITPPHLPRPLTPEQAKHYAIAVQNAYEQAPNQPAMTDQIRLMQQSYKQMVRTLITVKQTALQSLYRLYAEREYDPNIAKLQLKDTKGNHITNAQALARYAASWRVFSPQFYAKINTASSSTLLRQLLILSAERHWQAHQLLTQLKQQQMLLSLLVLQGMQGDASTARALSKTIKGQIDHLISGQTATSAAAISSPEDAQAASESLTDTITGGGDD